MILHMNYYEHFSFLEGRAWGSVQKKYGFVQFILIKIFRLCLLGYH